MGREDSLVYVGSDLLYVELLIPPGQELFVICDVEQVNLKMQVHRWSLPELKDLAIIGKQKFLWQRERRVMSDLAPCLPHNNF